MITHYQRELQHNYLILKEENKTEEMKLWETDYRIPMLSNNNVNGLLPTKVHYENGQVEFYYEISSKQSLDRIVEKISMDYTRLKRLIKDVKKVLQELELYLLPEDGLLLRPEYIFMNMDTGQYDFCYYPWWHESAKVGMHKLLEYLLNYLNYQDKTGVAAAYEWYRLAGTENFSIREMEVSSAFRPQVEIRKEDIFKETSEMKGEYMPEWTDDDTEEKLTLSGGLFQKLFKKKELSYEKEDIIQEREETKNSMLNKGEPTVAICEPSGTYGTEHNTTIPRDSTMFLNQGLQPVTRRLVCKNSATESDFLLTKFPFVIGKGEDWADGVLQSCSVSRMHAQVECEEGEYYIRDLNSTNGTFVNGELLEMNEIVKLEVGDRICFAEIEYDFL